MHNVPQHHCVWQTFAPQFGAVRAFGASAGIAEVAAREQWRRLAAKRIMANDRILWSHGGEAHA